MLSSVSCTGKGFTADSPCRGQIWGAAGFALSPAERGAAHGTGVTPAIVSHQRVPSRSASRSCVPPPSARREGGVGWQPGQFWSRGIAWEAGDPPGGLSHLPAFACRHLLPRNLSCEKAGRTQVCSSGPSGLAASPSTGDWVLLKLRPLTKIRISTSNDLDLLSLLYHLG